MIFRMEIIGQSESLNIMGIKGSKKQGSFKVFPVSWSWWYLLREFSKRKKLEVS